MLPTNETQHTYRHARHHLPPLPQSLKVDESGYADILGQVRDGRISRAVT